MAVREYVRCPGCGRHQKPDRLGLSLRGDFDLNIAQPNELSVRRDTLGGRARCTVEFLPLPTPQALGVRQMLKYRLAQVEEELRAAGVDFDDT